MKFVPSCRVVLAGFALLASSACVTTRAETRPVDQPALEVPPPPPRVIAPLPVPDLPPQEPVAEDPNSKPSNPPKPKPQPQPNTKPAESKPPDAPVEATQPTQPPPVAPPVPTLSTPPQGDANAVARQVRDSITRTRAALDKINYGPLSNDRKKAYDDAKLFATQAEEALKANNLVFAKELADKAERLAKELQSR